MTHPAAGETGNQNGGVSHLRIKMIPGESSPLPVQLGSWGGEPVATIRYGHFLVHMHGAFMWLGDFEWDKQKSQSQAKNLPYVCALKKLSARYTSACGIMVSTERLQAPKLWWRDWNHGSRRDLVWPKVQNVLKVGKVPLQRDGIPGQQSTQPYTKIKTVQIRAYISVTPWRWTNWGGWRK